MFLFEKVQKVSASVANTYLHLLRNSPFCLSVSIPVCSYQSQSIYINHSLFISTSVLVHQSQSLPISLALFLSSYVKNLILLSISVCLYLSIYLSILVYSYLPLYLSINLILFTSMIV